MSSPYTLHAPQDVTNEPFNQLSAVEGEIHTSGHYQPQQQDSGLKPDHPVETLLQLKNDLMVEANNYPLLLSESVLPISKIKDEPTEIVETDDQLLKEAKEEVGVNGEDSKLFSNGDHLKKEEIKKEELADTTNDVDVDEDDDDEDEDEEDDDEDDSESEDDEEASSDSSSEEPIQSNPRARLRKRSVDAKREAIAKKRSIYSKVSKILRKSDPKNRSKEEQQILAAHPKVVKEVMKNSSRRKLVEDRKKEIEDLPAKLNKKCLQLSKAIQKAQNLVVYTGAGISTAANIPDYRGPNGVWTLLEKGQEVAECNLALAEPTYTHMALFTLFKKGKLKHIVSQNCDGLHLRSGIPRYALSEVHGNMFIEICKRCKPMRPFIRRFDVTERTNRNRHNTGRRCHVCGHSLVDTIVHFGERGYLKWPINWDGASKAAEKADMILCLGSSLKVLRRYPWLWCMDRPKKDRPSLYIVNLQWTPKDSAATLKLNGKCDEVMKKVMSNLDLEVPMYASFNDPLLTYATPLHPNEEHTTSRTQIVGCPPEEQEFRIRSWSLDHAYANKDGSIVVSQEIRTSKSGRKLGCLVPRQGVDYRSAVWPRDALYCSYKELKFEYVLDAEAQDQVGYYCDCCDPAKKRKRNSSDSDDDDEEDDEDEDEEDEEDGNNSEENTKNGDENNSDDENSKSSTAKTEASDDSYKDRTASRSSSSLGPGWFGKGRRIKRPRT